MGIYRSEIADLRKNLEDNIGKKIIVKESPGKRSKPQEKVATIENTYPKYFRVKFEDVDWEKFWNYHSDLNYSGLESMKSVYKRVSSLLEELKEKAVDKDILFVTHGGVSKAINWYFNGLDKTLLVENCKIYKYTI